MRSYSEISQSDSLVKVSSDSSIRMKRKVSAFNNIKQFGQSRYDDCVLANVMLDSLVLDKKVLSGATKKRNLSFNEASSVYMGAINSHRQFILRNYSERFNSRLHSVECGSPLDLGSSVPTLNRKVENGKEKFSFGGLKTCGCISQCSCCYMKVADKKKHLSNSYFTAHAENGCLIVFATLTVRHNLSDSLKSVLNRLVSANSAMWKHRKIRSVKEKYGYKGYARVLEVPYGFKNGWHPHMHYSLCFDHDDRDKAEAFMNVLLDWWCSNESTGADRKAQDFQFVDSVDGLAQYMAKSQSENMAVEMSLSNGKTSDGLTIDGLVHKLDCKDYKDSKEKYKLESLVVEYSIAMYRKTFWFYSKGLREMYPEFTAEADKSDEELLKEELGDTVLAFDKKLFRLIRKKRLVQFCKIEYVRYGLDGLVEFLRSIRGFNSLEVELYMDEIPILTI